ncbi:unannotated protein [freshwater metagenome]|uniref:Unannotated protein n=1 Tax=freshwater metagenome TaxID=449393 RepID=A0A6J6JV82_9ZZZZ
MGRTYQCRDRHPPEHWLSVPSRTLVLDLPNSWGSYLDRRTFVVRHTVLPRRGRHTLAAAQTWSARSRCCRRCVCLHAQPLCAFVHGSDVDHPHAVVCAPLANRSHDLRAARTHVARSDSLRVSGHCDGRNEREFRHLCSSRTDPSRPVCHLGHERDHASRSDQVSSSHCRDNRTSTAVVGFRSVHPREIRTSHPSAHRDGRNCCRDINCTRSASRSWLLVLLRARRTHRLDRISADLYNGTHHASAFVHTPPAWPTRRGSYPLEISRVLRRSDSGRARLCDRHLPVQRPVAGWRNHQVHDLAGTRIRPSKLSANRSTSRTWSRCPYRFVCRRDSSRHHSSTPRSPQPTSRTCSSNRIDLHRNPQSSASLEWKVCAVRSQVPRNSSVLLDRCGNVARRAEHRPSSSRTSGRRLWGVSMGRHPGPADSWSHQPSVDRTRDHCLWNARNCRHRASP